MTWRNSGVVAIQSAIRVALTLVAEKREIVDSLNCAVKTVSIVRRLLYAGSRENGVREE
jgi:hypothetical protein